jgi:hypothetical protein
MFNLAGVTDQHLPSMLGIILEEGSGPVIDVRT